MSSDDKMKRFLDVALRSTALVLMGTLAVKTVQRFIPNPDDEKPIVHIPRVLDGMAPVRDALITFSEFPYADIPLLERVGRRCASLLETYIKVNTAKASTVKPSIITLGDRYVAAIKYHLYNFYTSSGILLVKTDRQLVPVNRDLLYAHETLLTTVDCLANTVEICAREKIEQGVTEKV